MKKSGKKWFAFDFSSENESPTNKISFIKNKKPPQTDYCSIKTTDNKEAAATNFFSQLLPKTVTDLAVHSKKIKKVEWWLENNVINAQNKQTTNFLLITGPTGSGKTTTLNVLCRNMSITVTEWLNPMDQDFDIYRGPNQLTRFTEFLTESRWNSLFTDCDQKKLVLVKDFPNTIIRNPEEFSRVLEDCYYKASFPIVFICTEMSSNRAINLSQSLFPQEIQDKYRISHISFNPCASTQMKNALKRAQTIIEENSDLFKVSSPSIVEAIIATSMGDIRSAINQYYFASLLGSGDIPLNTIQKPVEKGTKRKRNEQSSSTIKLMSRDENLGFFHGLGRILNPKRIITEEKNNSWRLNCDLDKLIDEFSIQPRIYVDFLFENYMKYFGDINDLYKASDIFSISQLFLNKWTDKHETLVFALWICVMGLMISNEHKASKWNQIVRPKKVIKNVYNNSLELRNLTTTDHYYYNIIIKKKQCNNKFKINN